MLKIVEKLKSLYQNFYQKIYISIVVSNTHTQVYVEIVHTAKESEFATKTFETTEVTDEMEEYIKNYISISPFFYISILNNLINQGAVPTCSHSEISKFADIGASVTLCIDEKWSAYSTKFELDTLQEQYASFGLDFIFSPFLVLNHFFLDKVQEGSATLFVLVQDVILDISIFEDSKLLYAEHYVMGSDKSSLDDESHKDEEFGLDEDESEDEFGDFGDFDDISDLDSLDDIEDLDMIEDLDEFSVDFDDGEEEQEKSDKSESKAEDVDDADLLSGFNQDYRRFAHIKSSLENFYKDEKYCGQFVETVYIANGSTLSDDLKNYLEDELFLNVYIRNIEIANEVNALAKLEVDLDEV